MRDKTANEKGVVYPHGEWTQVDVACDSARSLMLFHPAKQARDGYGKRRPPYGYDRVYFDEAGNEMHRVVGNARFSEAGKS